MANKDHVFFNFLENLTDEDRKMMIRAMSDHEIMENCCSEEEFRMITDRELPPDFAAYRPDRATEAEAVGEPDVTPESLSERLEEIKKEFGEKPSMARLEALADKRLPRPEKSDVEITINIGQLREKAENLPKP